jgi:hypothetical protein
MDLAAPQRQSLGIIVKRVLAAGSFSTLDDAGVEQIKASRTARAGHEFRSAGEGRR